MARTPMIAGNWKMNKTVPQALEFVRALRSEIADVAGVEVVLCPPATALYAVREELAGTDTEVALGAQDCFWKNSGAYTGQVSPIMLVDIGAEYVIVGHSEPRGRFGKAEPDAEGDFFRYFGESDHTVHLKIIEVLNNELSPILCVGETLGERHEHQTDEVIQTQVQRALGDVSATDMAHRVVIAYEPVWAIGTGETCDTAEANRVCGMIRDEIAKLYDPATAEAVRILYGGSMKPGNAEELLAQEHIDGGLVGGASLVPADFATIVKAAAI